MQEKEQEEFSLKNLLIPLTTLKAIHIIFIVGFIVYFNTLFNGFVWDDKTYIINYPLIHQADLPFSFGPNLFNIGGQYRPIPVFYFSFLYTFFGNASFFYHFLQIILHIVCAILIFKFFRKFLHSGIAFFSALLFLVHPINVESVSYIAQTTSPLFLLFGLVALLVSTRKRLSKSDLFTIFLFLLLSILTKETGVLFIPLVFIYRVLFVKDNKVKLFVISVSVVIVYLFFRFFIGQVDFSTRLLAPVAGLTLLERLTHIPIVIFYYIKTFFFPISLAIDQQWTIPSLNFSTFYFPLLVNFTFFTLIGICGYYLYAHRKQSFKIFLFFTLWFILGLFLHSQIYPLDYTVADRWFYFPIIGLLGMLAIIYKDLLGNLPKHKAIPIILAVLIVFSLSYRTILRNNDWHDAIALYTHDIQINDNYSIQQNLGIEYTNRGEHAKALEHHKRSVLLRPYEGNLHNLGVVYAVNLGDIEKARKYLSMALHAKDYKIAPMHKHAIDTYIDYATILVFYDKDPQAVPFIMNALEDYPTSDGLWFCLAIAKYNQHDKQGALVVLEKAYKINPNELYSYVYIHIQKKEPFDVKIKDKTFTFH